jgi:hypothetical protein
MWFDKRVALTGLMLGAALAVAAPLAGQQAPVVAFSVRSSAREAGIRFEFQDGKALHIAFLDGQVLIDGSPAGGYRPGGALEAEWRRFLTWAGGAGADEAVAVARAWKPADLAGGEGQVLGTLRARLETLSASRSVPAPPQPPADADIEAAVAEAVAAADRARSLGDEIRNSIRESVRENVRPDIRRSRDARPEVWSGWQSEQARFVSPVGAVVGGLLGLVGTFVALTAIAFGVSFFGGRQLDVVADTVSTSLVRSFFVGLFAQPLILPAFGAMIAGLTLTVIGILVIPVAIVAFVVALLAAALGGYLAVARVAGSAFMKRRRGDHGVESFGILRSVAYGLAILLAVWLPAVILSWVPVAGSLLTWAAVVFTWMLMTTGFGAALLTRGGVRATFGRRFTPPELPPATLYERPGPEISTGEWLSSGKS